MRPAGTTTALSTATLDTLAGGIESAIGVARGLAGGLRGHSAQACDDGCDAAMLEELEAMTPVDPTDSYLPAPMSPLNTLGQPTPIESMPEYHTPLPPSTPLGPRSVESHSMQPPASSMPSDRLSLSVPASHNQCQIAPRTRRPTPYRHQGPNNRQRSSAPGGRRLDGRLLFRSSSAQHVWRAENTGYSTTYSAQSR